MRNQLPDTPWHIGSPKMKESDHRRLNKWCIHYDSSVCTEPKSGCYMLRCAGSSHCKFYAEDEKACEKVECDNRTQEEIDTENRRQYVETLKPKMQSLISSSDGRRYTSVEFLRNCYVCGSKLLELGKHRKQCTLCHMEYIDQSEAVSDTDVKDGHFVYVMGQKKRVTKPSAHNTDTCSFCDDIGRCQDKESPLYKKRCKPNYCNNLKKKAARAKRLKVMEFTGVKHIPLTSIAVRNMSPPNQNKLDRAIESIHHSGGVTKPIYVEIIKDKYLIKDGYIRYLAAQQCGLATIPATLEWEGKEKK